MLKFWCLVLSALPVLSAYTVQSNSQLVTSMTSCANRTLDFGKSTDSAIAYNTAYAWTGTGSLLDWQHNSTYTHDRLKCLDYAYSTRMLVPRFFHNYLGIPAVKLHIEKTTCANRTHARDVAVVTAPMIIPYVRTIMQSEQKGLELHSQLQVRYEMPWMLSFLEHAITRHIVSKCEAKAQILLVELCQ